MLLSRPGKVQKGKRKAPKAKGPSSDRTGSNSNSRLSFLLSISIPVCLFFPEIHPQHRDILPNDGLCLVMYRQAAVTVTVSSNSFTGWRLTSFRLHSTANEPRW